MLIEEERNIPGEVTEFITDNVEGEFLDGGSSTDNNC